ncbi:MAG: class I SAM-dependent rRNA methyltransferase [Alphaproteobacteria bacterium]|nr:class I SAM-dependent rRNA methyltransferase [Alphaproteobacteria bacterium]
MRAVTVNGYSAKWLRKGFPWVYPKEVVKGRGNPGEWVELRDERGERLGVGIADSGWLAVRVFGFGDAPGDATTLRGLLGRAAALRDAVIGPETTGYRLVHAENDGLPGVRVDWWSHHATVVLDSPALAPILPVLVEWLIETRAPRGIHLCYRTDPRDAAPSRFDPAPGLLDGHVPTDDVRVLERGVTYGVRPHDGPDVGLYADMRDVRAWLEPTWGGTRVLNTFAYTGAFSVSAAFNGAAETVSVDLSQKYLDRAEANFRLNELALDAHEFVAEDTFKALDRFRRTQRMFDRVILDPPSYSHSREGTWSAKKDLPRLVGAAARVIDADGWVVVASNQGEMSPRDFRGLVLEGFKRADRVAQEIWVGSQGPDFPASSRFPEGRYLKVAVWRLD